MDAAPMANALDRWFRRNGRDLPWRAEHDPYQVLLAEFILQQTRMETGLPYFDRLRRRFPTIHHLARARRDTVVGLWSGLGYYSRARNLHATARRIVKEHGGRVPSDPAKLRALPGIGPYTAGAIASIGYDLPEPALDGNQLRVWGRLLGRRESTSARSRRVIEAKAREFLRHGSPRRLNQALMDLGSSVCLPGRPRCGACPLARYCEGRRSVPARPRRAPVPRASEDWEVLVYTRGTRIWLRPPKKQGLLAGLWVPPMRRAPQPLVEADRVHEFSHKRWRLRWVHPRTAPAGRGRWASENDLGRLPHARLTREALKVAFEQRSNSARRVS